MGDAPVLILPGLYNSGPEHWQSHWESAHPQFRRVMQDDWERPRCDDWIARLDAAVRATPDAVLVAHSSSCALVAHWAGAAGSAAGPWRAARRAQRYRSRIVSGWPHRIRADAAATGSRFRASSSPARTIHTSRWNGRGSSPTGGAAVW